MPLVKKLGAGLDPLLLGGVLFLGCGIGLAALLAAGILIGGVMGITPEPHRCSSISNAY